MPSNVEIKARLHDVEGVKRMAEKLSGTKGRLLKQEDVFFIAPHGRLKLRKMQEQKSELIFYNRPDQAGPKCSEYNITLIDDPDSLQDTLTKALGIKGIVKKERLLYIVGQTRVHVDAVVDLGDFVELEVVMKDGQSREEGQKTANQLMVSLGIENSDLVEGAYMDLFLQKI